MTQRLAHTIPQATAIANVGRTKLYEEIAAGRLPILKVGRKTLIRHEALLRWLEKCERETDSSFWEQTKPEITIL